MGKKKVLFVCIHNSARSQMAEALLNVIAPDYFQAESAGIEQGSLNQIVVNAMNDIGIDISSNKTKNVQDFIDDKRVYDYIITVCDEARAQRCPVFPGKGKRMHMGFEDPSSFDGNDDKRLEKTIAVRNQIKIKLQQWVQEHKND